MSPATASDGRLRDTRSQAVPETAHDCSCLRREHSAAADERRAFEELWQHLHTCPALPGSTLRYKEFPGNPAPARQLSSDFPWPDQTCPGDDRSLRLAMRR